VVGRRLRGGVRQRRRHVGTQRRRRGSAAQRVDGQRGSGPAVSAESAKPVGQRGPRLVDLPIAVVSYVRGVASD